MQKESFKKIGKGVLKTSAMFRTSKQEVYSLSYQQLLEKTFRQDVLQGFFFNEICYVLVKMGLRELEQSLRLFYQFLMQKHELMVQVYTRLFGELSELKNKVITPEINKQKLISSLLRENQEQNELFMQEQQRQIELKLGKESREQSPKKMRGKKNLVLEQLEQG